jgi:hypothetical protein
LTLDTREESACDTYTKLQQHNRDTRVSYYALDRETQTRKKRFTVAVTYRAQLRFNVTLGNVCELCDTQHDTLHATLTRALIQARKRARETHAQDIAAIAAIRERKQARDSERATRAQETRASNAQALLDYLFSGR